MKTLNNLKNINGGGQISDLGCRLGHLPSCFISHFEHYGEIVTTSITYNV